MQYHKKFKEDIVKFYITQLVIAVGELHDKGVIHRDLKLENIMMQENGYLKLIDFGMSRSLSHGQLTQTFLGTPEYIAPEMFLTESKRIVGYDKSIDWWAIGILAYEMIVGRTPFYHNNRRVLNNKIMNE